jgi:hypothetical protein
MRTIPRLTLGVIAAATLIVGSTVTPALAAPTDDYVTTSITGGSLSMSAFGANLSSVTLDGSIDQQATGTSAEWTITDARGTGAEWTVSVSATDFFSAAGTADTTARTLAIENLTLTPGTVTATTGSDTAPTATALTVTNDTQSLIATGASAKGVYNLTPEYTLDVPAKTFRSNFVGTVGSSDLAPYISTITFTII